MKLIGITGKAGAGKTTFSDMLAEKDNIGVIHIDDILRKIKLKYFKILMGKDKQGEKAKVNSKMKTIIYKNKMLFDIFMKFRAKLVEKPLKEEINQLENMGKKIILIDDIFIQYQKCYEELSQIFLVERPFIDRRKALENRDELSKEEVVSYDVAHVTGNYKDIVKGNNTIKIINNKSKQELSKMVDLIYQRHFSNIKDKYKVKNLKIVDFKEIPKVKERENIIR